MEKKRLPTWSILYWGSIVHRAGVSSASSDLLSVQRVTEAHTPGFMSLSKVQYDFICILLCQIKNWQWVGTFPCQKIGLSSSPLKWPWVHNFRCQKNRIHRTRKIGSLRSASLKWRYKWSKNRTSYRTFCCTVFLPIEKRNQINTKNYWKQKKGCAWGCAREKNTTWENQLIAKHKSGRRSFRWLD